MGNAVSYCEEARVDPQDQSDLQDNDTPTKKHDSDNPPDAGTQHKDESGDGHHGNPDGDKSSDEGGEEGGDADEDEEPPKPKPELGSAPYDPRFPSWNQARHCYTRYNEFYKCQLEKGEDSDDCKFYQKAYRSMCPSDWVERWNEQRESGTWPGRY